jgi:transposase-like protein
MMTKISYAGYRFPPVVIQQAVWLYARFTLSFRDVEDLLAERGITVSYETVRRWVKYFGPEIAAVANWRPETGIFGDRVGGHLRRRRFTHALRRGRDPHSVPGAG